MAWPQSITNCLMGTFTRAILMGGARSSGLNKVPYILEQLHNFITMTQVTSLIPNVLVGDVSRETVKDKLMIQKVERWSLVAEAFTIQGTTVMISDKAVASLTIETNQTFHVRSISRLLSHEAKIHRDALVAHGCMSRVSGRMISIMKLSTSTDRTKIQFSCNEDRRNTLGKFVQISDMTRVKVTKTLMPQNAKLISIEMTKLIYGVIRVSKLWRWRNHRVRAHTRTLPKA